MERSACRTYQLVSRLLARTNGDHNIFNDEHGERDAWKKFNAKNQLGGHPQTCQILFAARKACS